MAVSSLLIMQELSFLLLYPLAQYLVHKAALGKSSNPLTPVGLCAGGWDPVEILS
jgi:hypothetical protein